MKSTKMNAADITVKPEVGAEVPAGHDWSGIDTAKLDDFLGSLSPEELEYIEDYIKTKVEPDGDEDEEGNEPTDLIKESDFDDNGASIA